MLFQNKIYSDYQTSIFLIDQLVIIELIVELSQRDYKI